MRETEKTPTPFQAIQLEDRGIKKMKSHFYTLLFALCICIGGAQDEEATQTESNATDEQPPEVQTPVAPEKPVFDASNEDWGSYYDPQNVFCGKFDCYKILGFDYESFGKEHPTTREITKRYRALSREWHPDKSKHKDAKNRFVKISRAYEVLTSIELRKEYDEMRYDQEKYYQKHGTSVIWNYAPKSDTAMVILILIVVTNLFSWFAQKHRWQLIADRLVKAAVEDWTPSQGGSPESKQLREDALAIIATETPEEENKTEASPAKSGKKAKRASNQQKKSKKQEVNDALLPVVTALVGEIHDFGGGFHKPTWRDLMIVSFVRLPFNVGSAALWQTKYMIRRFQKKELNEDEHNVLTRRAVGPVIWDTSSEDDRKAMIKRELWITENLADWNEEQEIKKLSAAEQKYYMKLKKKGQLDKLDKYE